MKIVSIVGARPNFMKIAPIIMEFKRSSLRKRIKSVLIHTGQHYDRMMSAVFFRDLELPQPDIYLGVGAGTHAGQTGRIMMKLEKILFREEPDLVVVVGDVNSTLAGALTAAKLNIPVAHVEAGLRSFDRTMPEEINRLLTDALSEYLFTTCPDANINLVKEGIPRKRIYFVGNVMIDTLLKLRGKAAPLNIWKELGLNRREYAVLTLHRPENVDNKRVFSQVLSILEKIQRSIKIVFPVHPRTKKDILEIGLKSRIGKLKNLMCIEPLGYLHFLNLMDNAKFVLTDSGGIQEETTVLGIPCLTLRKCTERPVTVTQGTNTVVGTDSSKIIREISRIMDGNDKRGQIPKLWDGNTAYRIVSILVK